MKETSFWAKLVAKLPPVAVIVSWLVAVLGALSGGRVEEAALMFSPVILFLVIQVAKHWGLRGLLLKYGAFILSAIVSSGILAFTGQLPPITWPADPVVLIPQLGALASVIGGLTMILYESLNDAIPSIVKSSRDLDEK